MAFLEIIHLTGETEQRPLEKRQSVSIGSHSSNDICIDDESVGLMHCRISWNRAGFEAVAAGIEPLELNGAPVQRAVLKPGDILRFGAVDIRYRQSQDDAVAPAPAVVPHEPGRREPESSQIELKPLSEESLVPEWLSPTRGAPAASPKPERPSSPPRPEKPSAPTSGRSKEAGGDRPSTRRSAEDDSTRRRARPKADEGLASPAGAEDDSTRRPAHPKAGEGRASPAGAEGPAARSKSPPARSSSLDEGLAALAAESRGSTTTGRRRDRDERSDRGERGERDVPGRRQVDDDVADETPEDESSELGPPLGGALPSSSRAPRGADETLTGKIRAAMRHQQQQRPGEQDPLRSPVVLALGGGVTLLVFLSAVFYFIGQRRTTQAAFDACRQLYDEQKYNVAIDELTKFLTAHPKSPQASEAKALLGYAQVDQYITGASPNFAEGLKQLRGFVTRQSLLEGWDQEQPKVAQRAQEVALGAAKAAARSFDRALLDVSGEAESTFNANAAQGAPPTEALQEIDAAQRVAEAAILKHETSVGLLGDVEAALAAGDPLAALAHRRELLARYPELAQDRQVVSATAKILVAEQARVEEEKIDRPAETLEAGAAAPLPLTLTYQGRTRTDQMSVGRAVPVLTLDSLVGVDTVTGAVVWRRSLGVNAPFFPIRDTSSDTLIAADSRTDELIKLDQNTGALLWRQKLSAAVAGPPLLSEGQIYAATTDGALWRLDGDTGALTAGLRFPQPIGAPAALGDGKRLVVPGDREVLYTLSRRPLACTAAAYTGQAAGTIVAPLLATGPYVLAAENRSDNVCRLRLFQTEPPEQPLREAAQAEVAGHVVDPPVIRGRDLYVPSAPERVSAFLVSDDPGQPPLTAGPVYEVKGAQDGPIHLATASDGELFMATHAVRRLQPTVEALQPSAEAILPGRTSQPLRSQDRQMFVARRRPYSEATIVTPIDRATLTGEWQAVVGAKILATSVVAGDAPTIVCVTDAGHLFRASLRQLETGGFLAATDRLSLHDQLVDPLAAAEAPGGQVLVAAGAPEPRLWVVNRLGQIERGVSLPEPLQAAPAQIGRSMLAPVEGRMLLLQAGSAQTAGKPYALPSDLVESARWRRVMPAGDSAGVAALDTGVVLLLHVEDSPSTHLAERARYSFDAPLFGAPNFSEEALIAASVDGKVAVLSRERLDPVGERVFDGPVTSVVQLTNELAFVETGPGVLQALNLDRELSTRFSLPLDGSGLAGVPLEHEDELLIPLRDGRVFVSDPVSGDVLRTIDIGASLAGGPFVVGDTVCVCTLDGSLVLIPGEAP